MGARITLQRLAESKMRSLILEQNQYNDGILADLNVLGFCHYSFDTSDCVRLSG